MSGRVGDLSPKQEATLEKFRQNVADILQPKHDDHFLLRWLRARNFDLKASEAMLRNHMHWRKQFGTDSILENWKNPAVLEQFWSGGWSGFDKQGSPVWIDPVGTIDMKGLLHSAKKIDLIKNKVTVLERLYCTFEQQTVKVGHRVDQMSLIFDMDKFGMKHLWKPGVDVFNEILTIFEEHYPETLKRCYVINAPKIFPVAYQLIKPFLSEETKKKVLVLGGDWKQHVLNDIDPDQLPVHWGGTQVGENGDVYCKHKICMGGDVPKSWYLQEKSQLSSDDLNKATVHRMSSLQLELVVDEPGSAIRWEFRSLDHDIGFGVYLKTNMGHQHAGDMIEIVPTRRCNSHMVPEDGAISCTEVGTYVLRFDNTYSWTRNKHILYLVEILPPKPAAELDSSIPELTER